MRRRFIRTGFDVDCQLFGRMLAHNHGNDSVFENLTKFIKFFFLTDLH